MKRPLLALLSIVVFVALSVSLSACKQGVGEVCQINDDCEDGLVCNPGTEKCQEPGGTSIDASLIDAAPLPDANTTDAAGDPDHVGHARCAVPQELSTCLV